jgi:hypothetical protein
MGIEAGKMGWDKRLRRLKGCHEGRVHGKRGALRKELTHRGAGWKDGMWQGSEGLKRCE